jgi:hypothetical protein
MAKERGTKGVVDTRPGPGIDTSLDELAKGLASGTVSRGQALRWMGGALVGAALASIPGVAWADGGRCPTGRTRCNDNCVNLQTSERHCGSCGNRCRSTQTCCKGNCVNTQANERHCGSCGNRCPEEEVALMEPRHAAPALTSFVARQERPAWRTPWVVPPLAAPTRSSAAPAAAHRRAGAWAGSVSSPSRAPL